MRELTKNEKRLLTILGIVLIGWGSYNFIITPQSQRLEALNLEKIEYQDKISENNAVILKENDIDNSLENLNKEQDELASKYFPKLDQAQIMYMLNDLVAVDNFKVLDMTINRPDYEELGEFQVKKMAISISYEGTYMGVMNTIKSLKNSPRKILVDSVSMDREDGGSLVGDIALKIYGLDDIVDEAEDVIMIHSEKRDYGSTPFLPFSGYVGDNYNIDKPSESSDPSNPSNLTDPADPANATTELSPYSPGFSVDYEKENIISVIPGEDLK